MAGSTYMTYLPKPTFMTDKLSKSYARYIDKAGGDQALADKMAMRDAQIMLENEHTADTIYKQMMPRGFHRSRQWWKLFTGETKSPKNIDSDSD